MKKINLFLIVCAFSIGINAQIGKTKSYLRTIYLQDITIETDSFIGTMQMQADGHRIPIVYHFDSIVPTRNMKFRPVRICTSYDVVPSTMNQYDKMEAYFQSLRQVKKTGHSMEWLMDVRADVDFVVRKYILPTSKKMCYSFSEK